MPFIPKNNIGVDLIGKNLQNYLRKIEKKQLKEMSKLDNNWSFNLIETNLYSRILAGLLNTEHNQIKHLEYFIILEYYLFFTFQTNNLVFWRK